METSKCCVTLAILASFSASYISKSCFINEINFRVFYCTPRKTSVCPLKINGFPIEIGPIFSGDEFVDFSRWGLWAEENSAKVEDEPLA